METLWNLVAGLSSYLQTQLPWVLGLSVLFTVLALCQSQACNPNRPWWKSRDLLTDVQYFFFLPLITPYLRLALMIIIVTLLRGAMSEAEVNDYINNGRGPVGQLPFWAQLAFYIIGTDFLLYWAHRLFHGFNLWPFHAVHHSSLDVDWTTAYRAHPINQMFGSGLVSFIMILLGVPPSVMILVVPFDTVTAAFVHANLNWTLGPLKYVIATPVFHRWHHTGVDEGGDKNFASTFSIWDSMFGTFYMPEGKMPETYGVDDVGFPTTWLGQMVVPFRMFLDRLQPVPKKEAAS